LLSVTIGLIAVCWTAAPASWPIASSRGAQQLGDDRIEADGLMLVH
jgi:hypothetical protein